MVWTIFGQHATMLLDIGRTLDKLFLKVAPLVQTRARSGRVGCRCSDVDVGWRCRMAMFVDFSVWSSPCAEELVTGEA